MADAIRRGSYVGQSRRTPSRFPVLVFTSLPGVLLCSGPVPAADEPNVAEGTPAADAGWTATEQVCSGCHGVDFFAGKRQTRAMWRATVEDMFGRGAVGTEQQFEQIVSYLSAYRGQVTDVNAADPRRLAQALDISRSQAQAIVDFRVANGDFGDLEDLKKVPGLDPARIEEQARNLVFQ